jgi:hypothetical protein
MASPRRTFWLQAMLEELERIHAEGVMQVVRRADVPAGCKVLPLKWVFTEKFTAEGELDRLKARLVVQGFLQSVFGETFAPTSARPTLRVLLSLVAMQDWELRQLDVRTAFLQSELDDEVYVSAPPGFESGEGSDVVFKLRKALYGLKQAPRAWYHKLRSVLCGIGFKQSVADAGLYVMHTDAGTVWVLTYVDDLLVAGANSQQVADIIAQVKAQLDVRDMGDAAMFLNMRITRDREARTLLLQQDQQVADLLQLYGMHECTPASTPLPAGLNLSKLPNDPLPLVGERLTAYQALVGSLIYLSGNTRPDLAFAAGALARGLHGPTERHWTAALHVLRYLQGTRSMGLLLGSDGGPLQLTCYHDADFAADARTRKSISGFVWLLAGAGVLWMSKQQSIVADSTTSAEYVAAAAAFNEGKWLRKLLFDMLGTWVPMQAYCDNKATVTVLHKGVCQSGTKHLDIKFHYMHQHVALGDITLSWVGTHQMVADCLTKQVTGDKVLQQGCAMGLHSPLE